MKQKGRKRTNPVHDYHSELNEATNDYGCLIGTCSYRVKDAHGGNFENHLKVHHREQYEIVKKKKAELAAKDAPPARNKKKMCILNGVKISGKYLQIQSLRLVSEFKPSMALLDYDAFQAIVQPYIQRMPAEQRVTISARAVESLIPKYANMVRELIRKELAGKIVPIKIDGCTRNYRHFLGINTQICKGDKVKIRTLAVTELLEKHTAFNIKRETTRILEEQYGLKIDTNILSVTSDNGPNMILACKLMDHEQVERSQDTDFQGDGVGEEDPDDFDFELQEGDFHIQSVRCAAHSLQLAVGDASKEQRIRQTSEEARKLTKYLRTPTLVRCLRRNNRSLPVLDVATRWGTTHDMLSSIINLKQFVQDELSHTELENYNLTNEKWDEMDEIVAALGPAKIATLALQKENLLLGDFYSIWTKCKLALDKLTSPLATSLKKAMREHEKSQQYRRGGGEKLSPLFNYPSFNAALFLDPRYFSLLSGEQVTDAKEYLLALWARLERVLTSASASESDSENEDQNSDTGGDGDNVTLEMETDSDEDDEFEKMIAERNRQRRRTEAQAPRVKKNIRPILDAYFDNTRPLNTKANVLEYWQKQRVLSPELYELAMTVLAIPATQVSVERLFSALNYVLNPRRFSLSKEHIDDIMLLHANADLLSEIAKDELEGLLPEGSPLPGAP